MARDFGVTYGSLTIGRSQSGTVYNLHGPFRLELEHRRGVLTFQVFLQDDTASTFLTAEAALITAYTKPRQALTIDLGGTDRLAANPAANPITGFNAKPSCRKLGGDGDTGKSALWECSVEFELPADFTGQDGRDVDGAWVVDVDASGRRTITLTGTYTAYDDDTSAYSQYASAIETYAGTIQNTVDSNAAWSELAQQAKTDDADKVCAFVHVYQEILENETASAEDDSDLRDVQVTIRKVTAEHGANTGNGPVEPLVDFEVTYAAAVVQGNTQDLASVWLTKARPKILAKVRTIASGLAFVRDEQPVFDYSANRIAATMRIGVVVGDVLSYREEAVDRIDLGKLITPVWNGNPLAADVDQGPVVWIKELRRTVVRQVGSTIDLLDPTTDGSVDLSQFTLVFWQIGPQFRFSAGVSADEVELESVASTWVFRRVDDPSVGGGGASGTRGNDLRGIFLGFGQTRTR